MKMQALKAHTPQLLHMLKNAYREMHHVYKAKRAILLCLDVLLALGERMLDGGPAKATTFKSTEI